MYHIVFLVTKKADMTQDQFIGYWINKHTPLTAKLPGLREYRCYPAIGSMGDEKPPFDAVAYVAFDDEASCKAALESDEFKTAVSDGVNFQTVEQTHGFFAREFRII